MTKVNVFVYGRRQQRRQQQQQRRGYDNSSPDFRHGKLIYNYINEFPTNSMNHCQV